MNKKKLPMRTGVGVIVLNKENKIFVGKRADNPIDKWQMPQGGVDKGENFISAMKRELKEETSIQNIKILKQIDQWFEYELPKNLFSNPDKPTLKPGTILSLIILFSTMSLLLT